MKQAKQKPSLLILEDDQTLNNILASNLSESGYKCAQAYNLNEAAQLIKQQNFSHAIFDLNLNGTSSLDFIKEITTEFPEIRILVLTGYASINTAVKAIKNGAVEYLAKPVTIAEIGAALNGEMLKDQVEAKPHNLKNLEWENIQQVLEQHDFNISKTAEALNMHRRTLQRKLQKYNFIK